MAITVSRPAGEKQRATYTDAPELHPHLLLGCLQLLGWLLFHPRAWGHHLERIDPTLHPGFCLLDLSRTQRRHPLMRRMLLQLYVVLPLALSSMLALILWAGGLWLGNLPLYVIWALVLTTAGSLVSSMVVSVGVGTLIHTLVSVVMGLSGLVLVGSQPVMMSRLLASGSVGARVTASNSALAGGALVVMAALLGGSFFGLTGAMLLELRRARPQPQAATARLRQARGIASAMLLIAAGYLLANLLIFGLLGAQSLGVVYSVLYGAAYMLAVRWQSGSWPRGAGCGVLVGLLHMLGYSMAQLALDPRSGILASSVGAGISSGIMISSRLSSLFALPYQIARRVADDWAGVVASALGLGVIFTMTSYIVLRVVYGAPFNWLIVPLALGAVLIWLALFWWWPVLYYPLVLMWNFGLLYLDRLRAEGAPLLRWHSAFWDQHQRLPLFGLDAHVILVAERDGQAAERALAYLALSRQRWAAQRVQIEFDARALERARDLAALSQAHHLLGAGDLAGPASALLRSLSRISHDAAAALAQQGAYNQRLALGALEERLDALTRELTRSDERYAARFLPIATAWRQLIAAYAEALAAEAEQRQELKSPYVVGVPLSAEQEIFVGRTDITAVIAGLLRQERCPSLLLYGQRRMGKTSLLNNFGRLLPSSIVPLFVDLQGPASRSSDHAGLLYNLARGMADSAQRQRGLALPALTRPELADDPFTRFDEWLDQLEALLGGRTALLALDEFEALDIALAKGRFEEDEVLGMLRHIIQHRSRFKVLLAGSHTLDELDRWASYLINVQIVELGYLAEHEARQLIEQPIKDFALRYQPDASQLVLDLTRGHPTLVQLLCAEIVALKNSQAPATRRLATVADVEAAVPETLARGNFFFADLERNQVDDAGLQVLRTLAARGPWAALPLPELRAALPQLAEQTLRELQRRAVLEPTEAGYRFQVELMRRWFTRK